MTKVFAFSPNAEKELRSHNIAFESAESCYPREKEKSMWNTALWFANNWYRDSDFCDVISFRGVSIGNLAAGCPFFDIFLNAITIVETWLSIISKEKPDEIVIFKNDSSSSDIGKCIAAESKINFRVYTPTEYKMLLSLAKRKTRETIKKLYYSWLKKHHVQFTRIWLNRGLSQKKKANTEKHFLFVFTSGSTSGFMTLYPIIEYLSSVQKVNSTIIAVDFRAMNRLRQKKMPFLTFEDLVDSESAKGAKRKAKILLSFWKEKKKSAAFVRFFEYNGFNFWQSIEKEISQYLEYRAESLVSYVNGLYKYFSKEKVNAVVVSLDDHTQGRLSVNVAERMAIPSLLVMHAPATSLLVRQLPIHATKAAAWGELHKQEFVKNGALSSKLIITGCPRFDDYINNKPLLSKEAVLTTLKLNHQKKTVLLAPDLIEMDMQMELVTMLLNLLKKPDNIQLIIKLHPDDKGPEFYLPAIKSINSSDAVAVTKDLDLFSVLSASDVIITDSSTVGLEAMILDKPVIQVNLSHSANRLPYTQDGAALSACTTHGLENAIKNVLCDKVTQETLRVARQDFVYRYAFKLDGKATERVASLIMQLDQIVADDQDLHVFQQEKQM